MNPSARLLFDYLRDIIYDPAHAVLDVEALSEDMRALGKGVLFFGACVREAMDLAKALARGRLDTPLPAPENEIAAPIKDLHSKLKHLTWQAQQVARGDFQQRVDFLGDFSESFNAMTAQLEQQRAALLAEIEHVREKTLALEQTNSLLEALTEKISPWIIVVNRSSCDWLFINHQTTHILENPAAEQELRDWIQERSGAWEGQEQPIFAQLQLPGRAGPQYFAAEVYPLSWREQSALAIMLTDISEEKKYLAQLQTTAYTDSLTGLYNRRFGMDTLENLIADHASFVLCFVDMDNLKYVNDYFGHNEGDAYLLAVAEALRGFSPEGMLCRLGGDEFMILTKGWQVYKAREQMEAVREQVLRRGADEKAPYDRSFSYGIIKVGPNNTSSSYDLLNLADVRMYRYKRAHRFKSRP